MSASPDPVPPPAEDPAGGPTAMRFRIFKRGGWRRAFRLEEVFWDVLGEAADAAQTKIGDYVKALVDEAEGTGVNQSSMLRVHAAQWLRERLRAVTVATQGREVLHAALQAPVPCFVISSSRALIHFNAEFSNYVIGRAQAANAEDVSKARLSLDAPVDRLIEVLSSPPGRVVICGFTIRTSAAIATGRAKVMLAQPSRKDMLVGYILAN
ncbi:ribbon-helix-helix domain-containing protein [Alsobacter sp. SYSU M60028]|uniref:Ribbon-helix-helix domain-containing protein n=1 Tax=Alsobacter ponti TaxID=2962936 RepID=A0ABT1LCS8_9HYPH|nr:ribbon-helix-helix domain-containing protein [Alsobacter ponti]MCP8939316.1 ribbon-helix-helix domain-containing protein [Alsobacter ponti]